MLHEGEADLGLIPIAEVFNHGGYTLLPFGIGARGPVESVMLFSNCPLEELESILVDNSSNTSVNLLRQLLEELSDRKLPFFRVDIDSALERLSERQGALVIGDRALGLAPRFSFSIDLAEWWMKRSSHPMVFAAWAFRDGSIPPSMIDAIVAEMRAGVTGRQAFASQWAEERGADREHAQRYVRERIHYDLDQSMLDGATDFYRRGAAMNIFPAAYSETAQARSDRPVKCFSNQRSIEILLDESSRGGRISVSEGLRLAEKAALGDLALASDMRRASIHDSAGVSYIVDRNINYTNVCNVYCRFCAFYRPPEKNGRAAKRSAGSYLLTKEEIGNKIQEMVDAGGIQILLQGGLNPDLGIEYYEDLFRWIKANYPVNLHALSADEILHISRVSRLTLDEVFDRLIPAGLGSLPGGGAEILVDNVRRRIARLKSPAHEWLEVHRTAHRKGLTSTCTMMFGVQESWEDRLLHMAKLRQLQDETGGFTAFITWPFQDENTKIERGVTSTPEYLRVQAISRLFLDNIANVQSSWVTMGPSVGQAALHFGANDFGSVMFEENVVSAAGTTYCMDNAAIERNILEAGFVPWRRDVHYNHVA